MCKLRKRVKIYLRVNKTSLVLQPLKEREKENRERGKTDKVLKK
jgi:hypothetical protein